MRPHPRQHLVDPGILLEVYATGRGDVKFDDCRSEIYIVITPRNAASGSIDYKIPVSDAGTVINGIVRVAAFVHSCRHQSAKSP